MNPDDIKAKAHALADAGASAEEIEQYVQSATAAQAHGTPKIGQHGIPISDESPEEASYAQQALGGIASLAKDIPGAEAVQAGARAVVRGQPYGEALTEIRGAEDAAPKWVRRGNRVIGGVVSGAVAPGANVMRQGAAYGALSGVLKADPNAGLKDRAISGAFGAALGAVAPKIAQGLGTAARTMIAKPLGKVALAKKAAMEAADRLNYGKAAAEGNISAANPVPQAVNDVMDEADIRPYIAEIKASRTMKGANPAAILREAYKLMTERQKLLSGRILNTSDYKAGSQLEMANIEAAKRAILRASETGGTHTTPAVMAAVPPVATAASPKPSLREAVDAFQQRSAAAARRSEGTVAQRMARERLERGSAESSVTPPLRGSSPNARPSTVEMSPEKTVEIPALMPSFRKAVYEHADASRGIEAFRAGADATKRVAGNGNGAAKNLERKSPEAFMKQVEQMSPAEAKAALEGIMGRLKEVNLSMNPLSMFRAPRKARTFTEMLPYIEALDKKAGNNFSSALASFGIGSTALTH